MTEEENEVFYSLTEAAKYAHVCRQAIFVAIQKGQLKAEKRMVLNKRNRRLMQWVITKKDLDVYRQSKYNREKRVVDGEKLFDIEHDRWSVLHAAKTLGTMLGRSYPVAHLYYLIRVGKLRAKKKGSAWVIAREELVDLYHKESGENPNQLEFAE